MFCIRGEGQRMLCVYREHSVRSPREARALFSEGCWQAEDATPGLMTFLRALTLGFPLALNGLRFVAGRVALHSDDARALRAARELADCHGLSYFDGGATYAHLIAPCSAGLSSCCAVLNDLSVGSVVLDAPRSCIALYRDKETIRVQISARVAPSDGRALRLLGFMIDPGSKLCETRVEPRRAPRLLAKALELLGGDEGIAVTVLSRPHLTLVSDVRCAADVNASLLR